MKKRVKINMRAIFDEQMSDMYLTNQYLVFILKHADNQKTVERIMHWKVLSLLDKYEYREEDQKGFILPVFYKRK